MRPFVGASPFFRSAFCVAMETMQFHIAQIGLLFWAIFFYTFRWSHKTILTHIRSFPDGARLILIMILDKKNSVKKYISNMSNSLIFGGHFEKMQIRSLRSISQLADIGLWIQHTKLPLSGCQTIFFTKCLYLLTFLILFPGYRLNVIEFCRLSIYCLSTIYIRSPPKLFGGFSPNYTGMIPGWSILQVDQDSHSMHKYACHRNRKGKL